MELKGAKIKWRKVPNKNLIWGKIGGWTRFVIDLNKDGTPDCLRNFLGDHPIRVNEPGSLYQAKKKAQKLLHDHISLLEERIVLLST